MLTDQDINKLKEVFPTEDDPKGFPTKEYLHENFYDKTETDERFYTKEETDKKFEKVMDMIFDNKKAIQSLEEKMNKRFDELLSALDGWTKRIDGNSQELTMLSSQVNRNTKRIDELEERVE